MPDREQDLPFGWVISTDDQQDGMGNHVVVAYNEEHDWTIIGKSPVSHEAAFGAALHDVIVTETTIPDDSGGDFNVAFAS